MTFGERLIELRRQKGFKNRVDFANFLHIPSTTLRNYETDTREPSFDFLRNISETFGISLDYLLCLTDDPTPVTARPELTSTETLLLQKYRNLDDLGKFAVDTILNVEYQHCQELQRTLPAPTPAIKKVVAKRRIPYYQRLASAGTGEYLFDDIPIDYVEIPNTETGHIVDFAIGVNGDSMEPLLYDNDILLIHKQDTIEVGELGLFVVNNESFVKELGEGRLISINKMYPDILINESTKCIGQVLCRLGDITTGDEYPNTLTEDTEPTLPSERPRFAWAAANGTRGEEAQKLAQEINNILERTIFKNGHK